MSVGTSTLAGLIELDPVPRFVLHCGEELADEVCARARKKGVPIVTLESLSTRHPAEMVIALSESGASAAWEANLTHILLPEGGAKTALDALQQGYQEGDKTFTYVSRHAVAALLQAEEDVRERLPLVDLRRSDERERYGAIEGARHVPAEDLPSYARSGRVPKRCILQCRTNRRSRWGSLVLGEVGLEGIVLREGSYGWRFSPDVKPYQSYEIFDDPPSAEEFTLEQPDLSRGASELAEINASGPSSQE